jgi:predicted thioesterase
MAKKVVASLKKVDGKNFAKVIRAVRSEKTGSYTFKEEIVPAELVKETLAKK